MSSPIFPLKLNSKFANVSKNFEASTKIGRAVSNKKKNQSKDSVFRYVADLRRFVKETGALLDVSLVSVPKNSMLGALKGSDSI